MTIKGGWFDWAKREPGHPEKVYPGINEHAGIAWHSAEGYLHALISSVKSYDRKASWTGSIAFDGTLYQHYPVTAKTWASGNHVANSRYWSFELEGMQGISDEQIATCLRIAHEFEAFTGKKATRNEPRTMWEHREVAQIASPNAGPTSCPSGRYDPFFALLDRPTAGQQTEEEEMADEELRRAYVNLAAVVLGAPADQPSNWFEHYAAEAERVARSRAAGHEQLIGEGYGIGNGARVTITGIIEEETK